ncbi:MAG: M15 family metallopeptidase [Candidatus Moranbacteria bacterium]|nr:M15 family metallopeptidase [Candidatus Moranbacteria bacterium]
MLIRPKVRQWETEHLHHLPRELAISSSPEFSCPAEFLDRQELLIIPYLDFDGMRHSGQLVVDRDLADDVQEIFRCLYIERYPITSMAPIVLYQWSDEASMAANNTSGFNYRTIAGDERLSLHAYGRAIDINPWQNPCCSHGAWSPVGATYDKWAQGAITRSSFITRLFRRFGFDWGGDWKEPFDPQHFYKPL